MVDVTKTLDLIYYVLQLKLYSLRQLEAHLTVALEGLGVGGETGSVPPVVTGVLTPQV